MLYGFCAARYEINRDGLQSMDKNTIKGIIYGLQIVGIGCLSSAVFAATVQVKFSAHYTLPSGINKATPMVRLCHHTNTTKRFSHLFMTSALTPSQTLSQGISFPSTTDFVSPGLALRDGQGTTYYTYCAEQVPYSRLHFKRLRVVFGSMSRIGPRYSVQCDLRMEGDRG